MARAAALPSRTRCRHCGRRGETPLHTTIREQTLLLELAQRQRIPKAVRQAMVDVIDHAMRELGARKKARKR